MKKLRLGSIRYVNSLPVDLGILSGAISSPAEIIQGVPAQLNDRIAEGALDISVVSAIWYARRQKEFLLLPRLSISSKSGVQSVLLFSRRPISELAGARIAVTAEGKTTPALLEVLCRQRYGFKPEIYAAPGTLEIPSQAQALLVIGDDALKARERFKNSDLVVTDLAEEWEKWTGLPFVFAVWVVRREVFDARPEALFEVHKALLTSKQWGLSHPEEVIRRAKEISALEKPLLESYFSGLSYDFDASLKKGMRAYFEQAEKCGLLEPVEEFEEIAHVSLRM